MAAKRVVFWYRLNEIFVTQAATEKAVWTQIKSDGVKAGWIWSTSDARPIMAVGVDSKGGQKPGAWAPDIVISLLVNKDQKMLTSAYVGWKLKPKNKTEMAFGGFMKDPMSEAVVKGYELFKMVSKHAGKRKRLLRFFGSEKGADKAGYDNGFAIKKGATLGSVAQALIEEEGFLDNKVDWKGLLADAAVSKFMDSADEAKEALA